MNLVFKFKKEDEANRKSISLLTEFLSKVSCWMKQTKQSPLLLFQLQNVKEGKKLFTFELLKMKILNRKEKVLVLIEGL